MTPARRRFLSRSLAAGAGLFAGEAATSADEPSTQPAPPDAVDVRAFGAAGDGRVDDTAAIQRALDEAGRRGGTVVHLPRGNYRLGSSIDVPRAVTLQGVFRGPQARTQNRGSCLLAVANKGDSGGPPLIALHESSTLTGVTVFHPEQTCPAPPVEYPWVVRQLADNATVTDVLLVNPWLGVDLGTVTGGRHYVRGLYGQPLHTGLAVDRCLDVGRIADVHFWPFWRIDKALQAFTAEHATAFRLGRTDWEYMSGCFCIGYATGYHFVRTDAGEPNVVLTNCGSDTGPLSVRVDACQRHAGVSFVNGQLMAGVVVSPTAAGPVKFTNCGFWGTERTNGHATLAGTGHVSFTACHFIDWARGDDKAAPAISATGGGLTVSGCEFIGADKQHLSIGKGVSAALVFGNRFGGPMRVRNDAGPAAQFGLNAEA